jgi:hypothetical protein
MKHAGFRESLFACNYSLIDKLSQTDWNNAVILWFSYRTNNRKAYELQQDAKYEETFVILPLPYIRIVINENFSYMSCLFFASFSPLSIRALFS